MMTKKGFTLLEIILVLAIVLVIATVIVKSYSLFNSRVKVQGDAGKIASLLYKAKSDTISGRGGLQYGVHFESGKAVLFRGTSYSSGASTNQNLPLSPHVSIFAITLTGGGSEVVFQKLTGVTEQPGSIKIRSDSGIASSTISISANGLVTIQ
ncbi:MAG: type II secretion system protein [bacterium]|nr:type II secretion system protein [bacterium]